MMTHKNSKTPQPDSTHRLSKAQVNAKILKQRSTRMQLNASAYTRPRTNTNHANPNKLKVVMKPMKY